MRRAVVVLVLLGACKRDAPAPAPPATAAAPAAARPTGWSHGFGAAGSPSPPSAKQLAQQAADDDDDAVSLPPALAQRPATAGGVAVYVDGKQDHVVPGSALAKAQSLAAVAGRPARALLIHGNGDNAWIPGRDAAGYQLRQNRRGQIKLEPIAAGGNVRNGHAGGHTDEPDRAGRANEVRGVVWIEVRTPSSARLAGEPPSS